jgi:hypothetical protein
LRPEQAERFRRATSFGPGDPAVICTGVLGFPIAGLLSEPIKIVQAPRLTVVLYEAGYLHRQIFTDGRARFPRSLISRPSSATPPDIVSATL